MADIGSGAITLTITMVATTWVMGRILAGSQRVPAPDADGSVALRYGAVIRAIGVACSAFSLACLAIGVMHPPRPGDRAPWVGLVVFFALGGLWMVLAGWREVVVVRRTAVEQRTMWGGRRELAWDAVRAVRFSRLNGYVDLEGTEGRVRASVMLRGVAHLWDAIAAHVPRPLWSEARAQYDVYMEGRR